MLLLGRWREASTASRLAVKVALLYFCRYQVSFWTSFRWSERKLPKPSITLFIYCLLYSCRSWRQGSILDRMEATWLWRDYTVLCAQCFDVTGPGNVALDSSTFLPLPDLFHSCVLKIFSETQKRTKFVHAAFAGLVLTSEETWNFAILASDSDRYLVIWTPMVAVSARASLASLNEQKPADAKSSF